MTINEFASMAGLKQRGNTIYYDGHCPHREDDTPSFTAWEYAGWIWFIDRTAGNTRPEKDAVRDQVLVALGLSLSDLATGAERYVDHRYKDASGQISFKKRRIVQNAYSQNKREQKDFRQLTDSGDPLPAGHSDFIYDMIGLQWANRKQARVHIVNGEKAADAIKGSYKEIAVCKPNGEGSRWADSDTDWFRGVSEIWIWRDLDSTGESFGRATYETFRTNLTKYGIPIKVVTSKTGGQSDDAFDHVTYGFGLDDAVIDYAIVGFSGLIPESSGMDFEFEEPSYLLAPYIPYGKLTILDAQAGAGKTTFVCALAAHLSSGTNPIDAALPFPKGKTLYLHSGEDDNDHIEFVCRVNGSNPNDIMKVCQPGLTFDTNGIDKLRLTIDRYQPKLVVVDALVYFFPRGKNENVREDVEDILMRLANLARETGVAWINIRHFNKSATATDFKGKNISDSQTKGTGSYMIHAKHRSQLVLRPHPQDHGVSVITHAKGNLLTPTGYPIALTRDIQNPWKLTFTNLDDNPFDDLFQRTQRPDGSLSPAQLLKLTKPYDPYTDE